MQNDYSTPSQAWKAVQEQGLSLTHTVRHGGVRHYYIDVLSQSDVDSISWCEEPGCKGIIFPVPHPQAGHCTNEGNHTP